MEQINEILSFGSINACISEAVHQVVLFYKSLVTLL